MDSPLQRKFVSILNILYEIQRPLGGTRIAQKLQEVGYDLSQRTVRYYLEKMDKNGLTQNLGKRGRIITLKGEEEIKNAFVFDKVGVIASKIDTLTYQMDFSLRKLKGKIILNVSTIHRKDFQKAIPYIQQVFRAGLGMGRLVVLGFPGDKFGNKLIADSQIALGTVCSVTINGVLLKEGIHTTSRFGGILELVKGRPLRFTEIINYDGSSLDPLEIFIKGRITSVYQATISGSGKIGASFREFPAVAFQKVEKIKKKLDQIGLGDILMIGKPSRPLLGIPVSNGRVGMILAGGLNPLAAVEECGINTENTAMGTLFEFDKLMPFWEIKIT
ncbi:MAG: NrpR regulatory domain-containing protein [Thermodesulfobacteriota bacterium]|jgi:repressor of nif and glnA expression|nr:MAG: NrpR regulatory domain-containing protein [Thermodesulfobacteriota bacterium]